MKKFILLIIFIAGIIIAANRASANEMILSSTLGVSGGYSLVTGYYSGKLDPGPSVSVHYIPYIGKYLMSELDVSWSRSQLSNAEDSFMSTVSFAAGPVLKYNILQGFDLFGGTMLRGSVLLLHAETTGRDSKTFKPGFNLLAGFYADIPFSLRLRTCYTYSQFDLSEHSFSGHEISAGVCMGFYSNAAQSEETDIIKVRKLLNRAVDFFDSGNYEQAQKGFDEILSIDTEHRSAHEYIRIISDSSREYNEALVDIRNDRKIAAIVHLENTHVSMKKAQTLLREMRDELFSEKETLHLKIKKAYKENDYNVCLKHLSRLQKIDPEDKVVKIYFPRVRKRMNTIRKFQ